MHILRRIKGPIRFSSIGLVVLAVLILGIASCRSRYSPTRRTEANLDPGWPKGNNFFHQVSYGRLQAAIPEIPGAELVDDDELCLSCHKAYTESFAHNVHRGDSCESCHGPASRHLETRGKEPGLILSFKTLPPAQKSELCLKCHEEDQCAPGAQYRYSKHAHCGVACTDCHTSHYNVPPGTPATTEPDETTLDRNGKPITLANYQAKYKDSLRGMSNNLGAVAPDVCYRCHGDMQEFEEVAGPHQICGPNGFNCTTCHDPHGKIRERTRTELCLECHTAGSPTMAFHSSTHDLEGVACTDCHNPHPSTNVQRVVNISYTHIQRPKRRQMAVQEPEVCYKCHPKIFGLNALPSHHPIKEGKMVCSDCHDGHGQLEGNLKGDTLNDVCYKCHAEKQGPFVYEHAPVDENCGYCHEPHGTVANNLLRQPAPFLCLRCHSGHRERARLAWGSVSNNYDVDGNHGLKPGYYTYCTQCHAQIHGSNLHGIVPKGTFMR